MPDLFPEMKLTEIKEKLAEHYTEYVEITNQWVAAIETVVARTYEDALTIREKDIQALEEAIYQQEGKYPSPRFEEFKKDFFRRRFKKGVKCYQELITEWIDATDRQRSKLETQSREELAQIKRLEEALYKLTSISPSPTAKSLESGFLKTQWGTWRQEYEHLIGDWDGYKADNALEQQAKLLEDKLDKASKQLYQLTKTRVEISTRQLRIRFLEAGLQKLENEYTQIGEEIDLCTDPGIRLKYQYQQNRLEQEITRIREELANLKKPPAQLIPDDVRSTSTRTAKPSGRSNWLAVVVGIIVLILLFNKFFRSDNPTSPTEAVQTYYTFINLGNYDESWELLSPTHQQSVGREAYMTWWLKVKTVEIGEVKLLAQSETRAVVYVELRYLMHDGPAVLDVKPYAPLSWDARRKVWLLEPKQATMP